MKVKTIVKEVRQIFFNKSKLENYFYPTANSILKAACEILNYPISNFVKLPISEELVQFKGPF